MKKRERVRESEREREREIIIMANHINFIRIKYLDPSLNGVYEKSAFIFKKKFFFCPFFL